MVWPDAGWRRGWPEPLATEWPKCSPSRVCVRAASCHCSRASQHSSAHPKPLWPKHLPSIKRGCRRLDPRARLPQATGSPVCSPAAPAAPLPSKLARKAVRLFPLSSLLHSNNRARPSSRAPAHGTHEPGVPGSSWAWISQPGDHSCLVVPCPWTPALVPLALPSLKLKEIYSFCHHWSACLFHYLLSHNSRCHPLQFYGKSTKK